MKSVRRASTRDDPAGVGDAFMGLAGRIAYGALFCFALPAAMIVWLHRLDHFVPALPMPVRAVGALAVVGTALMAWSMLTLIWRGQGLPMNAFPTRSWVTTGPFAIVAHPIYVAFVLIVAGVAIAAHSVAGLYVGAPFAALAAAALVLGYEGPATLRRLGPLRSRPWLSIPIAMTRRPTPSERVGAGLLVFGPWLGAFLSLAALPVQPRAFTTWLPFEATMPFSAMATLLYVMTYWWAVVPVLVVRDLAELRRFCVAGLVGTAVGCAIYLVCPAMTPPRGVPGAGILAEWLSLERANDSVATAMPSFHVFWSVIAGAFAARATRLYMLKAAIDAFSAAQVIACHLTGMHSNVDIVGGLTLAAVAFNIGRIYAGTLRLAEIVANKWAPIRVGPLRIFPHGGYVVAAGMIGLTIAATFMPAGHAWVALVLPVAGLVGAGAWGHAVEGTHFSRPFGFFGGLFGASIAAAALAAVGLLELRSIAAMTIGLSFCQAVGRLRCLAQGCCHGAACEHDSVGLCYRHPLSRVTQIECLAGRPVKPAPVASIGINLLVGTALVRMAVDGLDALFVASAYLVLTGLGRFIEEAMRGEPQTPAWCGLNLYQWLSFGLVAAGMALALLPRVGSLPEPSWPGGAMMAIAAGISLLWAAVLSVDWPWTNWRFSRLAPMPG